MLRDAPDGAVGFYPLSGGRPYMTSQIWHGKPLATTLNFPANQASLQVLRTIRESESAEESLFRMRVREIPNVVESVIG